MFVYQKQSGALLVLVLVFGAIFFLIVTSFMGFVITQNRVQQHKLQSEKSIAIAESGLNYYKWYLAHYPDDVTYGTGQPGPYEIPYQDPESGMSGTSTIDVSEVSYCGLNSSILIESTGVASGTPAVARTLYARYARPSVAEFSFITNSSVWAGPDRNITGPYHSNGGIRMDGTNNSTVTSGVNAWICDSSFGCSPSQWVPGVVGSGPNDTLWDWPVPEIDFNSLGVDLLSMKNIAQNNGGTYIGPSGRSGYRIRFLADGTYDLYEVRSVETERSSYEMYFLHKIKDADFIENRALNSACPLVFVEDNVWLEGDVPQKVTLASASEDDQTRPTIILQDNITYANDDAGLLAVAEKDVLVGFDVPNNMEINGIFLAQTGHFGRNNYYWVPNVSNVPDEWDQYVFRDSLRVNGTIVSRGRIGTQWVYGNGNTASGFLQRYASYDRRLVLDPPALTPKISDNYKFIEWRQE